ncbi:MAG TPA: hypothetical protein VKI65_09255 [Gemmataceae bacterium]|nr:hypothetical protein [Gemmataceae bacterium]
MSAYVVRYLLLFLVVSDCADDWLVAAVTPTPSPERVNSNEDFAPIAIRYRLEIQKQIDEPFAAAAPLFVVAPPAPELQLLEQQTLVLPPLPDADPLYAFMSLQR